MNKQQHEKVFRAFMRGGDFEKELRTATDFLAGTQSITYTEGSAGGFLVPQSFQKAVAEGLAQVDPLLDANVSSVIFEKDLRLPPLELPGWDLSTVEAVLVSEGAQHNADTVPATTQKLLNKFTYRLSLGATLEWEQDQAAFDSAMATMGRAFGVGFARGIGADLINGNGSGAPSGILNGLSSAFTTANSGKIVLADIENAYFGVNAIYRSSPKCAWLLNDASYKMVRNATDNSGRPLLNVIADRMLLMGKPVYIAPSLPTTGTGSFCVFGDLSHYYVHASTLYLRRRLEVPGYVEAGKALFTGLLSVDAVLHDPTAGAMPPVIAATLHA